MIAQKQIRSLVFQDLAELEAATLQDGEIAIVTTTGEWYVKNLFGFHRVSSPFLIVEDTVDFTTDEPNPVPFGAVYINTATGTSNLRGASVLQGLLYSLHNGVWIGNSPEPSQVALRKSDKMLLVHDSLEWTVLNGGLLEHVFALMSDHTANPGSKVGALAWSQALGALVKWNGTVWSLASGEYGPLALTTTSLSGATVIPSLATGSSIAISRSGGGAITVSNPNSIVGHNAATVMLRLMNSAGDTTTFNFAANYVMPDGITQMPSIVLTTQDERRLNFQVELIAGSWKLRLIDPYFTPSITDETLHYGAMTMISGSTTLPNDSSTYTIIPFTTVTGESAGVTPTTGSSAQILINKAGFYRIDASVDVTSTNSIKYLWIYKNGTQLGRVMMSTQGGYNSSAYIGLFATLADGDVITARVRNTSGDADADIIGGTLVVQQVPTPQTILDTNELAVTTRALHSGRMWATAAQTLAAGTDTNITFSNSEMVTGLTANTAAGTFTVTRAGRYRISGVCAIETGANNATYYSKIRIGSTTIAQGSASLSAGAEINGVPVTVTKDLAVGNVIRLTGRHQGTSSSRDTVPVGGVHVFLEVFEIPTEVLEEV